jgi:hypothetical protein
VAPPVPTLTATRSLTGSEPKRNAPAPARPAAGRLSAGQIDALRYAGQRQLTRWGSRRLPERNAQRRDDLIGALRALGRHRHQGCELRCLPPGA